MEQRVSLPGRSIRYYQKVYAQKRVIVSNFKIGRVFQQRFWVILTKPPMKSLQMRFRISLSMPRPFVLDFNQKQQDRGLSLYSRKNNRGFLSGLSALISVCMVWIYNYHHYKLQFSPKKYNIPPTLEKEFKALFEDKVSF